MTKNTPLADIIKQRIRSDGPITFRAYMNMALYEPKLGYYRAGKNRIGRQGDFYTGPSSTPLFGRLLASWLQIELSERPGPLYTVAEFGAAGGMLADDIKKCLASAAPAFSKALTYIAADYGDRAPEAPLDCVISNELIDAFPVHRVRMTTEGLREIYAGLENEELVETEGPLSTNELQDYLARLDVELPSGFTAEINLDAVGWLRKTSELLAPGATLLTIDYGYQSPELYAPYRSQGTLIGYSRHEYSDNAFANIGAQDLTSHVNFSALMEFGNDFGLETTGYSTQSEFLAGLGAMKLLEELHGDSVSDVSALKSYLALKDLILPDGMGGVFKVLVQQKVKS